MKTREFENENTPLLWTSKDKSSETFTSNNFLFCILGFLGYFNVSSLRINISVALIAMVRNEPAKNSTESSDCPIPSSSAPLKYVQDGEFSWSSTTQGLILGAFFYGYVVTHIPGGFLAQKFGGKWVFGFGVYLTAFLSLFTPMAARYNVTTLVSLRVLEGFTEGVTSPAMHSLIATRISKYQRSLVTTFIYSGALMGIVISLPVTGVLCSSDFLGGWPSAFYVFGTLGCVWSVFWFLLIPNETSSSDKLEEKNSKKENVRCHPIPWIPLLKSPPVWILIFTSLGQGWGYLMVLTELPMYMSTVLHFDLQQNALLSALPYLFQTIFGWISGFCADYLYMNGYARLNVVRKTCNSIAYFGPALCLIGVVLVGCDQKLSVIFFTLSTSFNGFVSSGYIVSIMDMAPDFAGTLIGISSTIGTMPGFLAPSFVGYMIQDENSVRTWGNVFYTTAGIYIVTNIIYVIFGTAELQPWGLAKPQNNKKISTENESKTSVNTSFVYKNIISTKKERSGDL